MTIFARIAQMESSRIVGGRAQTQALLRAPMETSRTATTGACPPSGPRDAGTKYHPRTEIVRLPAGSIVSISRFEAPLEPIDLAQARFHKALLFALLVNFLAWGLILFAGRWLLSVL